MADPAWPSWSTSSRPTSRMRSARAHRPQLSRRPGRLRDLVPGPTAGGTPARHPDQAGCQRMDRVDRGDGRPPGARAELPTVNRKLAALRCSSAGPRGRTSASGSTHPNPGAGNPSRTAMAVEGGGAACADRGRRGGRQQAGRRGPLAGPARWPPRRGDAGPRLLRHHHQRAQGRDGRQGKGRKPRVVKLSKTLRHALLELGVGRRSGPVLVGQRGRLSIRDSRTSPRVTARPPGSGRRRTASRVSRSMRSAIPAPGGCSMPACRSRTWPRTSVIPTSRPP